MKKVVIITASGSGTRSKSKIPKQFIIIKNKPIIFYTIEKFYDYNPNIEIIVTLNQKYFKYWQELIKKYNFTINHKIVEGGETRFDSIKNAISTIPNNCLVAIHDAVRPFISSKVIKKCFLDAKKLGNAVPFIKINESVRKIDKDKNIWVNRNDFILIQTPQVFRSDIILSAYNLTHNSDYTDDASLVESMGYKINLVAGNLENFKITTPYDITLAKLLIYNDLNILANE